MLAAVGENRGAEWPSGRPGPAAEGGECRGWPDGALLVGGLGGGFGRGFSANATEVEQEGLRLPPVKLFKREDVPVSLGLIVDNSGSMRERRSKVESAAVQMVKASNQLDQVFIVNFNDEAYLDCDFTSNVKEMEERGLSRIDSRGGTAFYDALGMSIDHLKAGKRDKKVLMLITDGADNASGLTLEKLLAKIHAADGLVVHAIGLLATEAPREARKAKRALEEITKAGGGLCFLPKELDEVDKLALQVAHDIRNQYAIGYSPTNQNMDGTFRQVRVVANGPNKPVVRTRSGYYATPDQREPKVTSAR